MPWCSRKNPDILIRILHLVYLHIASVKSWTQDIKFMGYFQTVWGKMNLTTLKLLNGKSKGKPGRYKANLPAAAQDIILQKLIKIVLHVFISQFFSNMHSRI